MITVYYDGPLWSTYLLQRLTIEFARAKGCIRDYYVFFPENGLNFNGRGTFKLGFRHNFHLRTVSVPKVERLSLAFGSGSKFNKGFQIPLELKTWRGRYRSSEYVYDLHEKQV
jgi:hypothetical protein